MHTVMCSLVTESCWYVRLLNCVSVCFRVERDSETVGIRREFSGFIQASHFSHVFEVSGGGLVYFSFLNTISGTILPRETVLPPYTHAHVHTNLPTLVTLVPSGHVLRKKRPPAHILQNRSVVDR